jgi:autoinducer 2 (AI-2) kinase
MALDAGIGGGRCLIFTTGGQLVARGYQEWVSEPEPDYPGALSFNPDAYWAALVTATQSALRTSQLDVGRIAAVSTTCQREGFLLLDSSGEVLYAGPSPDGRGHAENAGLKAKYGPELYTMTGHQPESLHAPGRLLWLHKHRPAVYERVDRLLMINDWMLYRLGAPWQGEPSNACSTTLFDVRHGTWSDQAIALAGLPRSMFPPVVPSGTAVGELSPAGAGELGLPPGIPLVAGGGDGQCGVAGAGAVHVGDVAAIAGTTTPILMHLDAPVFDAGMRTWTRAGLMPHTWGLEANAGITGLAFRWLRNLIFGDSSEDDFPAMEAMARSVPPGANDVRCDLGARPMGARPLVDASGGEIRGIGPMAGGRAEIVRAAMESTCYAVRANVEILEEVSARPVGALRLVGGQSRSPFWVQMQADILGKPVILPGVTEASGWGAAICAGIGIRLWREPADVALKTPVHVVEPRRESSEIYEDFYKNWQANWV